ncbi:MAG TPA: phospho-sugar mutase [Microbacteriaceae bacterium]|nr:phospho-sugar mutase [Microbacteriaceae bacterium]
MTIEAQVRAWLDQDPDPQTRAELKALVAAGEGSAAELRARFAGRLAFGTAGLRAELGAGPMRMNRVVVAQAAAGLAAYLRAVAEPGRSGDRGGAPSVVIGYDGRTNSDVFARDAAAVMAGAGLRVQVLPRALPTPVLAFCVRHLGADAGLMITASHNPPRDNGLKVYLGGADEGSQIVPPADGEIAAAIERVAAGSISDLPRSEHYETLTDAPLDAYVTATATTAAPSGSTFAPRVHDAAGTVGANVHPERVVVAYTAMHGVGYETVGRAFAAAGLPALLPVPEQCEPDGRFPTLVFPNPEEPGALDLASAFASAAGADLIVANDPDADRLAIAVPDAREPSGWRRLTGNEVGLLLGWDAAERAASTPARGDAATPTLANSLVSSPGLARIAEHWGLAHAETLTGFKWISRVPGLVYGYEEALGYLVNPDTVRDKDGISAAVRFVALVERWHGGGRSVDDALDELAATIGGYASGQVSLRVSDLDDIGRLMAALRETPPTAFSGIEVARTTDYLLDGRGDILRYDLADGSRVIVRPSGTEPKLKAYLDARSTDGTGAQRRVAAGTVVSELEKAVRELLR